MGDQYSIQITTTFDTPAGVIPAGSVDYDNVTLTAAAITAGGHGGNGAGALPLQLANLGYNQEHTPLSGAGQK